MLTFILTSALYLVAILASTILIKELTSYIRYRLYYAKQGIRYHYQPISGELGALHDPKGKNIYGPMLKLMTEDYKDEDLVIMNRANDVTSAIFINNHELLKEYLVKENEVSIREVNLDIDVDLGFLLQNGHQALELRATFADFFKPENLRKITPEIQKIISKRFDELKDKVLSSENPNEFQEVDIRELFSDVFFQIVNQILFGSEDHPTVDGIPLTAAVEKYFVGMVKYMLDPLNMLTFGLAHKLKLNPKLAGFKELARKLNKAVLDLIQKRKLKKPEELGVNLIDLMLKHNLTSEKKLTDDQMVSNTFLFQIAGNDTTKNSSETFIKFASARDELVQRFRDEMQGCFKQDEDWNNYDSFLKSDYVNMAIAELMRMHGSAGILFTRRAVKDFKIGRYNLKKGDRIIISPMVNHYKSTNFENPKEFRPERFSESGKSSIKRNSYIPFYTGKRACIGKYLAELTQRMVILNFLKRFELKGNGAEMETTLLFAYGVKECNVLLRPSDQ